MGREREDLTKKVDRNTVPMMGVAGNVTQLSKNDGVVSYSTIISIAESPVMPGIVWAGTDDGNLQVSRDGGMTFTEVGKNLPGLPPNHQVLDLARRRVALRPGHRLRVGRRPPQRRPEAVRLRHARLRQDLPEHHRQPAGVRQRAGHPRGSEEQGPALRRHRVRPVRLARRREELAEVHEQLSDGADRRHPGPPARQRPDRRDARPERLDCRRHHAAAAVDAGGARVRRDALRHPSGGGLAQRSAEQPAGRRAEGASSARTRRAAPRSATT